MADAGASTWDIAGAIGGAVTLLSAIGTGFWRLITRADRQTARLEKKEAALVAKLEERIATLEKRDEIRAAENVALRIAFEIVSNIVRRDNPSDPDLKRAEAILAQAFPLDPTVPVGLLALAARAV